MKISVLISAISLVGLAAISAMQFHSSQVMKQKSDEFEQQLAFNQELTKQISELKLDIVNYQQDITDKSLLIEQLYIQLEQQKQPNQSASIPLPSANEHETSLEQVATQTTNNIQNNGLASLLAFAKRIKSGESSTSIENDIYEKFPDEQVDADWAYEYEANIRDLIATDESNKFDIKELNCKTTACELKIYADQNNAINLGTEFSSMLGKQDWSGEAAPVMFSDTIKDGVMTIMIGRNANSFN